MRVVWKQHPITAFEVVEKLSEFDANWHPKTVRTLLARLVKKGALGYTPRGNVYFYAPLVTERECIAIVSESFLDRVFSGSLKPMLAHFVERQDLTKDDLTELRRIFENAERGRSRSRRKDK